MEVVDYRTGAARTMAGATTTELAASKHPSVSGGSGNTASGSSASVGGGEKNTASGRFTSASGGNTRSAESLHDWVAGSLFNDE